MMIIRILAVLVYTFLAQCVASSALPPSGNETESEIEHQADLAINRKKKSNLIGNKPYTKWWLKPECVDFGTSPSDKPGWNYKTESLGYCECRKRKHKGRKYWACRIAVPNDHIIDQREVEEAKGDHWLCGQSVLRSIGSKYGGTPWKPRCLLGHDQVAYLFFDQLLGTERHAAAKRLQKIQHAFHAGTCNAFSEVRCIDLNNPPGDLEEESDTPRGLESEDEYMEEDGEDLDFD